MKVADTLYGPKVMRSSGERIEGKVERDARNYESLARLGWRVLIVWECELKKRKVEDTLKRIIHSLQGECCD